MRKILKVDYWTLAVFLMDYHSGQWSRGYRLLCRLGPANFTSGLCDELRQEPLYEYLVEHYQHKV
jgi:hypothetical protein